MNILALDTSTAQTEIAITSDDKVMAEISFYSPRSLSAKINDVINNLLYLSGFDITDIDLLAASIGPGSFTGVRCGVATVQGLGVATSKPCVGFSSLAMRAMNFTTSSLPICSLLDARKSEVYGGVYDCTSNLPETIIDDCVMSIEELLMLIKNRTDKRIIFVGEGAIRYRNEIISNMGEYAIFPTVFNHNGSASNGAFLAKHLFDSGAAANPENLIPKYIRASDAEMARNLKQGLLS